MSVILVASSEPRVGRSLIAAVLAYRLGRAGKPVTLARLDGDGSAAPDAVAFASLDYMTSLGKPIAVADVASLGDVVLEAPAGSIRDIAVQLGARVVAVAAPTSSAVDAGDGSLAATVLTRVPASSTKNATPEGVLAALPEDYVLAAPSVSDIAATIEATWLAGKMRPYSIDRVMIGTVASDAASPYFGDHRRTCVITRFDKTDIQLAALLTDLQCLVLTGVGAPSPYLLDRVASEDVAVLQTSGSTPDTMRAIEGLYALSRFEGEGKLLRAVELLDQAKVPVEL